MSRNPTPINGDGTSHCLLVADQGNIDTGNAQPPRPQNFSASSSAGMQCVEGIDPSQCVVPAVNRDGTSPTSTVAWPPAPAEPTAEPPAGPAPTNSPDHGRAATPVLTRIPEYRRAETDIYALLLAAVRSPGYFAEVRDDVRLKYFDSIHELHFRLLWQALGSCHEQRIPVGLETLHAELCATITVNPAPQITPEQWAALTSDICPSIFRTPESDLAGVRGRRSKPCGDLRLPAAIVQPFRALAQTTDISPQILLQRLEEIAEAGHRVETGVGKLPDPCRWPTSSLGSKHAAS